MSTAFHVGTYLQMGDDFDSRNRFLRQPADGIYEGQIVAGETWSVKIEHPSSNNYFVRMRFQMGSFVFDLDPGSSLAPTGVATGITSE